MCLNDDNIDDENDDDDNNDDDDAAIIKARFFLQIRRAKNKAYKLKCICFNYIHVRMNPLSNATFSVT
jgi:hypothetical protein